MKAVLVIDTDEIRPDCAGCIAHYITTWGEEHPHRCEAVERQLPDDCEEQKPEWCPLKELPERQPDDPIDQAKLAEKEDLPIDWTQTYCTGWNACYDKISGAED